MDDSTRNQSGQFTKGRSGNPKGRPRKDRSVNSAILQAANDTVAVTMDGRRKTIRKVQAAATQIANKAAAGDLRAGKMMMDMTARAEAEHESSVPNDMSLTQSDLEIAEAFLAEFRRHIEREAT